MHYYYFIKHIMLIRLNTLQIIAEKYNANTFLIKDNDKVTLANIAPEIVIQHLTDNFHAVELIFINRSSNVNPLLSKSDVDNVAYHVVLYYLHLYNQWNNTYKKMVKKSLVFDIKDLDAVSTFDIIVSYFRKSQDELLTLKSTVLLGLSEEEFAIKLDKREKYYNR